MARFITMAAVHFDQSEARPPSRGDVLTQWRQAEARVNLDRMVVHLDGNMELFPELRKRYGGGVRIETAADLGVALVARGAEGLTMAALMREFPLVPLDRCLDAARHEERRSPRARP